MLPNGYHLRLLAEVCRTNINDNHATLGLCVSGLVNRAHCTCAFVENEDQYDMLICNEGGGEGREGKRKRGKGERKKKNVGEAYSNEIKHMGRPCRPGLSISSNLIAEILSHCTFSVFKNMGDGMIDQGR